MKLKISKNALKQLLLEIYVDDGGNKVSDRSIINDSKFMTVTGFYKKLSNGGMSPCSVGVLSYWKKQLCLHERDVYDYHTKVTKKIGEDVTFMEWSKRNNEGHKKKPVQNKNYDRKQNLIKFFGLDSSALGWDLDTVEKVVFDSMEEIGKSKLEALLEFEEFLSKGGVDE